MRSKWLLLRIFAVLVVGGHVSCELPGSPLITTVRPQQRSVLVLFETPPPSIPSVIQYRVEINSTNTNIPLNRVQMTSVPVTVVSGLEEALDYVLKVFAINSDGMGPPATETFRTLGIEPDGPPSDIEVTETTRTGFTLSWTAPAPNKVNSFNGISVYNVRWKQADEQQYKMDGVNVTSLSYTVQGLSPGITYESIIVAGNEFGFSQDYHGGVIEVTTNEDVPAPPEGVVVVTHFTIAVVLWQPPSQPNGEVLTYEISYFNIELSSQVHTMELAAIGLYQVLTDVQFGENFSLRMRAATAVGWGPYTMPTLFTVVPQVDIQEKCALNDSHIRVVFSFSHNITDSITVKSIDVYLRESGQLAEEEITRKILSPQNYIDIPVFANEVWFMEYSYLLHYKESAPVPSQRSPNAIEIIGGQYYQCPTRELPGPTAVLPRPSGHTSSSQTTPENTPTCVTVGEDHTVAIAAATVSCVLGLALIVGIVVIATVCICKRHQIKDANSGSYLPDRFKGRHNVDGFEISEYEATNSGPLLPKES